MAEFVYEARARTGETRKGIMEAESVEAVQNRLKAQNLNPVKVKKKPKEITPLVRLAGLREGAGRSSRASSRP